MSKQRGILKRKASIRDPANRVLIVTEGTKTEPRYFGALLQRLGISPKRIVVIPGTKSDPIGVVDTAVREEKAERRKSTPFDSIWVVLDTEGDRAHLSEARDRAQACGFKLAISAPCFEYWFLLHFIYTTRYMTCYDEVRRELNTYMTYDKGAFDTKELLDHTKEAVDNAQSVRMDADRTGAQCPRTDVDRLVVEIDSYVDGDLRLLSRQ
jgi:hypothetical protein